MKKLTDKQQEKFLDILCQLSPENLTCDGELNRKQIESRYKKLTAEWRKLEIQVGHKVTEEEVINNDLARFQ